MFTAEVIQDLQYYVYRLIDPRNGETFYIGKGIGNRVFMHARGEESIQEDDVSDKIQRIRAIRLAGFEVGHVIHRHGLDEHTAFEVEAALIDAYPGVTNIASGHGSDTRGVMHSQQAIEQYKAEEIIFQHKVIMININQSVAEKSTVYDAVRHAWRIDPNKANDAELVLALQQGIVRGVFVPEQWLEATAENFPAQGAYPGRWGFIGHPAPAEITAHYIRKRLPPAMCKKGAANPVRYFYAPLQ